MGFRIVFLPNCLLILSILKHTNVGAFLNQKKKKKKKRISNRGSPLNSTHFVPVCLFSIPFWDFPKYFSVSKNKSN